MGALNRSVVAPLSSAIITVMLAGLVVAGVDSLNQNKVKAGTARLEPNGIVEVSVAGGPFVRASHGRTLRANDAVRVLDGRARARTARLVQGGAAGRVGPDRQRRRHAGDRPRRGRPPRRERPRRHGHHRRRHVQDLGGRLGQAPPGRLPGRRRLRGHRPPRAQRAGPDHPAVPPGGRRRHRHPAPVPRAARPGADRRVGPAHARHGHGPRRATHALRPQLRGGRAAALPTPTSSRPFRPRWRLSRSPPSCWAAGPPART